MILEQSKQAKFIRSRVVISIACRPKQSNTISYNLVIYYIIIFIYQNFFIFFNNNNLIKLFY